MKRRRLLIATGYWLAFLLIVLPLLQPLVTLLPMHPGETRWRLQALGALSQSLILPLTGGVVAAATAIALQQYRVLRWLSLASVIAGVLLGVVTLLFGLDLIEYRRSVGPELREYYLAAAAIYCTSFTLATSFLVGFGIVGWRAASRFRREPRDAPATPVLRPRGRDRSPR